MQQRFDITRSDQTNRLSIREFAVTEKKYYKRTSYTPIEEDYNLIHEVSYDSDKIRAAMIKGQQALVSALRTRDFFPVYPCAEIIAERVADLFDESLESHYEVFFDDRSSLPATDQD